MRRLIPAVFAALLFLTACGSSGSGLNSIDISKGKTPTVKVNKDFSAKKTEVRVVKKGDGDKVKSGDMVTLDYEAINGRTGKSFDSSFKTGKPLTITIKKGTTIDGFVKGVEGQTVGSRILVAIPPKDGGFEARKQLDLKPKDTMVFLFDIIKSAQIPTEASGKAEKLPDTLPTLSYDKDNHPAKFTKTAKTPATVKKMGKYTAIQGTGPAVTKGQNVTFEYLGQIYPSGKIFDESWSRPEPFTSAVGAGQLIKCWDDGIVGEKIGSRIILVCPADTAYGKTGSGTAVKPGDTLIFAVDLLAAF